MLTRHSLIVTGKHAKHAPGITRKVAFFFVVVFVVFVFVVFVVLYFDVSTFSIQVG